MSVNTNRVFAKVDKVLEFEKALATHSQKYHTGDWKWRVFEISSGPDAGGYHDRRRAGKLGTNRYQGKPWVRSITMTGIKT